MAEASEENKITVGNYTVTIRPFLGKGQFALVYKAVDKSKNTLVAAKEITTESTGRQGSKREMAQRELRILQNLPYHNHVVNLLDYIIQPTSYWLFLEYCDLNDLKSYLENNAELPLFPRITIMQQAASAIAFMHNNNPSIIHRDIKLENILMKRQGNKDIVKVTDFGLSKFYEERLAASFTAAFHHGQMTTACGTAYYMAPEFYAELETGLEFTAAVDVFALGLVFELILNFGPENADGIPRSVEAKQKGQYVNIGYEMVDCHRKKRELPKIVEHVRGEDHKTRRIKRIITNMTKFRSFDRKNVTEVDEELVELLEQLVWQQQELARQRETIDSLKQEHQSQILSLRRESEEQVSSVLEDAQDQMNHLQRQIQRLEVENDQLLRERHLEPQAHSNTNANRSVQAVKPKDSRQADRAEPQGKSKILSYADVCSKQWTSEKETALSGAPCSLRVIRDMLYCCCYTAGITVYSSELAVQQQIQAGDMGFVYDVAGLPTGELIVAAYTGLFLLHANGDISRTIDSGFFTCVIYSDNYIYAAVWSSHTIHVYDPQQSYNKVSSVTLPPGDKPDHWFTFTIQNKRIVAACVHCNTLQVFSLQGNLIASHDTNTGGLDRPHVMSQNGYSFYIVANSDRDLVQVIDEQGQCSAIDLQPPVERPYSAVFLHDKLFVTSHKGNKLFMYKHN